MSVNPTKGMYIVLDRQEHYDKCVTLLNDKKEYKQLKKDPTQKIQKELNKKIDNLLHKKLINCNVSKFLKSYNSTAPYGLPKIHKENTPMRPVTSFTGSPIYNISKFISVPIQKVINKTEARVKNIFDFVKQIKVFEIPSNFVLLSLDVKSLFTNIPKSLVLKCAKLQWKNIKQHTNLPDDIFLDILECVQILS